VARGHEGGGLLVLHQHEPDAVAVAAEPFDDPVDAVSWDPEHGVDAPGDEPLDEQL
jgi:hypothetical protein